ncbi:hypothetical protein [Streptococcus sp. DD13]|uniref:hypothetical protein n=1 Tax=Streptococcus sp. DD13 TaxID=1777881 RepID=UPI00079915C5|nr:hypothetical protein [Streptococcus sp. DD13]KXT77718.1 hypothetical protein STRDD13_01398 [Streptococcus sp. DD13]
MVMITVHSKSDLNAIGYAAKNAATMYREATAEADRSFQMRIEGSEGAAISTFLEKINTLSTNVFSVYPDLLDRLGETIHNYTKSLEYEGFTGDQEIKSSDQGIADIKDWLTRQRYNSIESKENNLDDVIKKAQGALALSPQEVDIRLDTGSIQLEAYEELSRLAKARQTKHDNITQDMQTFRDQLERLEGELTTLSSHLTNAYYVSQVPVATLYKWVARGYLTVDNMEVIDSIRDKGDDEMLEVILSEGESKETFYATLGEVDASFVSQNMMNLAYARILENSDHIGHLQEFFRKLQEQDQEKAQIYLEKLAVSGTLAASLVSGMGTQRLPKVTGDYDRYMKEWRELQASGQLVALREKLLHMGNLNTLFESAIIAGVGKSLSPVGSDNPDREIPITTRLENLRQVGGSYSWDAVTYTGEKYEREVRKEAVTNGYTDSRVESDVNQAAEKYRELEQKKQKALQDLVKDLLLVGTDLVIPGFSSVGSFARSILEKGKVSSAISDGNDWSKTTLGEGYTKGAKGGVKSTSKLFSYIESVAALSSEKDEQKRNAQGELFGIGGSSITVGDKNTSSQSHIVFDLSASLQYSDFQENGVRGYILRQYDGKALERFDDGIKRSAMSQDMRDILTGNSDKPITEVGPDLIRDALNKMNKITYVLNRKDGLSWVTRYYDNNYRDFDGLTGNAKTSHMEGSAE